MTEEPAQAALTQSGFLVYRTRHSVVGARVFEDLVSFQKPSRAFHGSQCGFLLGVRGSCTHPPCCLFHVQAGELTQQRTLPGLASPSHR